MKLYPQKQNKNIFCFISSLIWLKRVEIWHLHLNLFIKLIITKPPGAQQNIFTNQKPPNWIPGNINLKIINFA